MKVKTSFFLLVIFALSGCAKMTYQRRSANYQSIVHNVSHVVVMPANIEVNTLDIKGKKTRMYNYEYHLEDVINRIVVSHLEKKGFKVSVLSKRDIVKQGLSCSMIRLREKYNEIIKDLYDVQHWPEEKAFSINKNVGKIKGFVELGDKLLVMIDYAMITKTNSARMLDFAASLFISSNATKNADNSLLILGMLQAKSGSFVWSNMSKIAKDLYGSMLEGISKQSKIEEDDFNYLMLEVLKSIKK